MSSRDTTVQLAAVGDRGRARRRCLMELLLSRPTLPALYARLPALWHRGTVVTGLARVSAQLGCFNTVRDGTHLPPPKGQTMLALT